MKKVLLTLVAVLVLAGVAFAATDTKPVTVSATVSAIAKLTISSGTLTFPNTDPDTTPIAATEGALSITAKARTSASGAVTLTVVSNDDLKSGATDTIAISNITWTASGTGFVAGTMNKTTPQTVGSWTGSSTNAGFTGTQTYSMVNSWAYATGNYSAALTYTLTAP
jgi:hypothetical protein